MSEVNLPRTWRRGLRHPRLLLIQPAFSTGKRAARLPFRIRRPRCSRRRSEPRQPRAGRIARGWRRRDKAGYFCGLKSDPHAHRVEAFASTHLAEVNLTPLLPLLDAIAGMAADADGVRTPARHARQLHLGAVSGKVRGGRATLQGRRQQHGRTVRGLARTKVDAGPL